MNALEYSHRRRELAHFLPLYAATETNAALIAAGDIAGMQQRLAETQYLLKRGEEYCALRDEPLTPIPVLPPPDSLAGGLRIHGYATRWYTDAKQKLVGPGYFYASIPAYLAAGGALTWNHDPDKPIGRVIHAEEDAFGLAVTGLIYPGIEGCDPRSPAAYQDVAIRAVCAGLLRGMSFFADHCTAWTGDLMEVCITDKPAVPTAGIDIVETL